MGYPQIHRKVPSWRPSPFRATLIAILKIKGFLLGIVATSIAVAFGASFTMGWFLALVIGAAIFAGFILGFGMNLRTS